MERYNFYKDIIKNYKLYGGEVMEYWNMLQKLYPVMEKPSFDKKPEYDGYSLAYGEMKTTSIKMIFEKYELFSYKVFIDLGAGTCNLPLYVAGFIHIKKSIGIEIVEERIARGKKLLDELNNELDDQVCRPILDKVELIHSDIFQINISEKVEEEKAFVWMSNLCFDDITTEKLFKKLYEELPDESIIGCSKAPQFIDENRFKSISEEEVEMTWNNKSVIHLYLVNKKKPINNLLYGY